MQYRFMLYSLLGIVLICFACGIVSTFLILKGWSLYGDALSHAVLPGIVIALAFDFNVAIGIFAISLLVTFVINYFRHHTPFSEQTTLAYVTSSFMGIGFLLYYLHPPGVRINEILFGKIVGLTTANLIGLGVIAALILIIVCTCWRTLAVIFFDRVFAQVIGLKVKVFEYLFYILIAITVMSSLRSVGSLLVVSLLIVPGAMAYILTSRLQYMLWISSVFSVVTGILGLYISYHYSMSTGATIITMQFAAFLLVFFAQYIKRRLHLRAKARAVAARQALGKQTSTGGQPC
ncbi:metal ABC transporter permease [Psittacicella hinzii]|nr:metal ABC transporter permease [Psittacicella hinzii]